jgi:N-acetylneuraminate lyase
MSSKHTDGLISALFTPLLSDGQVNYELIPSLVEHLIKIGNTGVFICGSNGEGPNLTLEERMQITELILSVNNKRLKTIVHVGHASIAEARKLARHAADYGSDAISSVAGFYFKPDSVQNMVDCMAEIASGAPELPFYYYHIPTLTGITLDTYRLMELAEQQIPNFAGVKFTSASLWEFMACLNYKDKKYDVMYGFDENHLGALSLGAKGAIGSTFCFAAPLYLELRNSFESGQIELARSQMLFIVKMIRIVINFPPIPAQKSVMKMIGFDMGPCRLPLKALTKTEEDLLFQQLSDIGFFERI